MTPIKKAYVDLPLGQIHYRYAIPESTSGEKPTPIVFLHQSASSSSSMEYIMKPYIAKGHACYAPDMPGFGGSFNPDPEPAVKYTTTWFCDIYRDVFKQLGLFKPGQQIHLVGNHSGGTLGMEICATYPEYIKTFTMIGASVMTEADRLAMKAKYIANPTAPFNMPVADGSHLIKTWNFLKDGGADEQLDFLQIEAIDHIRAWRGRTQIYGAVWEQDKIAMFMAIKCPILVLCSRGDVLWEYFYLVKELRPDARAEEIEGGNFSPIFDWEGCVKQMDTFIY